MRAKAIFGKIDSVKTQIIQLEVHDDTISVKDKMDWSQTPRILLVWPDRGKVFRNRLDLVLLERYCSSNGSQLALLTSDPRVIYQAEEAGIPLFQSRRVAQLQPWGKSFREFKRKELTQKAGASRDFRNFEKPDLKKKIELPPWGRILIFTIGVLAVLLIAGLLLPSAVITLPEEGTIKKLVVPLKADPDIDNVNLSGIIPARKMTLTVEGEKNRSSSGSVPIPDDYSTGEVIFTNLSETSISIPENSILSTSAENPILFVTSNSGRTPQGIGEQIIVTIRALKAGSTGNVETGQINRINQAFGADLTVTNPAPTTGGKDINVTAPNQTDRTILNSSLMTDLEQTALEDFQGLISEGDLIFGSSLNLIEIEDESSVPDPGFAGDTLTISKRIEFGIWYATGEDLNTLANEIVMAQYLEGDFEFIPGTLSLNYEQFPDLMAGWNLNLKWKEKKSIDTADIIQLALGKNVLDAEALIREYYNLNSTPEINIKPGWWFRLPVLPFRININENGK